MTFSHLKQLDAFYQREHLNTLDDCNQGLTLNLNVSCVPYSLNIRKVGTDPVLATHTAKQLITSPISEHEHRGCSTRVREMKTDPVLSSLSVLDQIRGSGSRIHLSKLHDLYLEARARIWP